MRFPLIAIPAISDEDVPVKNPANIALVQLDPAEFKTLVESIGDLADRDGPLNGLLTISLPAFDHEFVQTTEPSSDIDTLSNAAFKLADRLDDLAVGDTPLLRVDQDIVNHLRELRLVRDCDTTDEQLEICVESNTVRFRGRHINRNKTWVSTHRVSIEDLLSAIQ